MICWGWLSEKGKFRCFSVAVKHRLADRAVVWADVGHSRHKPHGRSLFKYISRRENFVDRRSRQTNRQTYWHFALRTELSLAWPRTPARWTIELGEIQYKTWFEGRPGMGFRSCWGMKCRDQVCIWTMNTDILSRLWPAESFGDEWMMIKKEKKVLECEEKKKRCKICAKKAKVFSRLEQWD